MSCPSELTLSIHADGELDEIAAARLERHLAGCARCAGLLTALRGEAELVRQALALPPLAQPVARPAWPNRLAAAACLLVVVAGLAAGWRTAGETLAGLPAWLNPFELSGALNLFFNSLFLLLTPGGGAMEWSRPLIFSTLALLAAGLALAWGLRLRPRVTLLALTLTLAIPAAPAGALEMRQGDLVEVAAGEVIDGPLVLAGETVRVEGTIDGDLVAFGRSVTVRGDVDGGIYAFAQNLDVEGTAGGSLHLFAQWVRLAGRAAGSGYMFAQGVNLLPGSRVDGDVTMFGETLEAEGGVGRDLIACGARVELRGEVGRHLEAWSEEVSVAESAVLGGDLVVHAPSRKLVSVADGATVGGEVKVVEPAAPREKRSRWADPGFYLWKLVGLVGAFLLGAVLWWLAPGLLGGRLEGVGAAAARLGIGLLVLVATPVVLLVVGLTLVGLPLALVGLALYLVALYLAKIATADLLGRALLGWPEETPRQALPALALGLAILAVVGLVPFLGGLVGFLALLFGLGLLAWRLLRLRTAPPPPAG